MHRLFIAKSVQQLRKCYTDEQIGNSRIVSTETFFHNPGMYSDVEYIFSGWGMPALSEEDIRSYLPSLKAVFYGAGSVQSFAEPFLHCGVRVFSAWAANAVPVAEFTAAQIILANKGYFQLHERYKKSYAASVAYAESFPSNYGTKVGLIGLGKISTYVIDLLRPYRLELLVCSDHLSQEEARCFGVRRASLEEIFGECQTISNHMSNRPSTRGRLNYALFSKMKPNATFINTGRGAQVDLDGLIRAMRECPDRTALLDVTDPFEPLPEDAEIWNVPNIYITPHRAGSMTREVRRMGEYMIQEFDSYLHGTPVYEVTEEMLKTMA